MDNYTHKNKKTETAAPGFADVCDAPGTGTAEVSDPSVRHGVSAERNTRTSPKRNYPDSLTIKIRAGAAGMFLAVVMTPFCSDAYISGNRLPVPADEEEGTQDVIIPESFAESEDRKNSDFEGEEELLHRWGLDSEDFPSPKDEEQIDIPEELLPYFQEMTAYAVDSYRGAVPPETDISRYSSRSNGIMRAVRQKADAFCRASVPYVLYQIGSFFQRVSNEAGPDYVAALQGTEKKSDQPAVSWTLPGLKTEKEAAAKGFPFRCSDESAGRESRDDLSQDETGIREDFFSESLKNAARTRRAEQQMLQTQDFSHENDSAPVQSQDPEPDRLFPGLAYFPEPDDAPPLPPGRSPLFLEAKIDTSADRILPLKDPSYSRWPRRTVFIGDSRTVGMQIYVDGREDEYWSAKNSMGYSWMVSSGVPSVEDLIGRRTDVVILMGVNDLGNMTSYVSYMNEKAAEWKKRGARTFFVSVTPVIDSKSPNAKNSRIESFNEYAQENLKDVTYIDAYNRIRYSFGSPDGIHFDGETYREIYRIIHFYQYTGWYEEAGLRFYFDRGRPVTGWHLIDGEWQYMDGVGVRWISKSRVGDVALEYFPESGLLNPYKAVIP